MHLYREREVEYTAWKKFGGPERFEWNMNLLQAKKRKKHSKESRCDGPTVTTVWANAGDASLNKSIINNFLLLGTPVPWMSIIIKEARQSIFSKPSPPALLLDDIRRLYDAFVGYCHIKGSHSGTLSESYKADSLCTGLTQGSAGADRATGTQQHCEHIAEDVAAPAIHCKNLNGRGVGIYGSAQATGYQQLNLLYKQPRSTEDNVGSASGETREADEEEQDQGEGPTRKRQKASVESAPMNATAPKAVPKPRSPKKERLSAAERAIKELNLPRMPESTSEDAWPASTVPVSAEICASYARKYYHVVPQKDLAHLTYRMQESPKRPPNVTWEPMHLYSEREVERAAWRKFGGPARFAWHVDYREAKYKKKHPDDTTSSPYHMLINEVKNIKRIPGLPLLCSTNMPDGIVTPEGHTWPGPRYQRAKYYDWPASQLSSDLKIRATHAHHYFRLNPKDRARLEYQEVTKQKNPEKQPRISKLYVAWQVEWIAWIKNHGPEGFDKKLKKVTEKHRQKQLRHAMHPNTRGPRLTNVEVKKCAKCETGDLFVPLWRPAEAICFICNPHADRINTQRRAAAPDLLCVPTHATSATRTNTERLCYAAQATISKGHVFVSGNIGCTADLVVVEGGVKAETRVALENVSKVLAAAGSSLARIVKANVYLIDFKSDFGPMNEAYAEVSRALLGYGCSDSMLNDGTDGAVLREGEDACTDVRWRRVSPTGGASGD
ncbi:hypothetical protein EVG20_g10260 [Dentipellis fragilis]|uniref:Uncharacterized protein n=1 Tax=Dentipellis fragilis TaxID=205917 RepID=A0A4Y9XTK8_9AGAM|nr:hypothetical protein EVG20_g10260 [Dentipellis fragilis]